MPVPSGSPIPVYVGAFTDAAAYQLHAVVARVDQLMIVGMLGVTLCALLLTAIALATVFGK